MRVCRDEVFRLTVEIGEITASAPGDEDFFARFVGTFEDSDSAAAFTGLDGAEKSGSSRAEDDGIEVVGHLAKLTGWNYTRRGFAGLRVFRYVGRVEAGSASLSA